MKTLHTPFPYIGGKSKIVHATWQRFGSVRTYIEPFAGSLAMLWGSNPLYNGVPTREIVNDKSSLIVNVWRAIKHDPEGLASYIENKCPIFEVELRARQRYLTRRIEEIGASLLDDPKYYDVEAAAYWIGGISAYVGHSFPREDGARPHVTGHGKGVYSLGRRDHLYEIFDILAKRLRFVRILCGDWTRLMTDAVMEQDKGPVAIFLDPPYTEKAGREKRLYHQEDLQIGHEVFEWCKAYGDPPNLRIALCGYAGEYDMPRTWEEYAWSSTGGSQYSDKERVWFSPNCLKREEGSPFLEQFMKG